MKPNRMKQKLRAGEPVFGVSVMIPSPQIVEMIAAAGFDWVLLDCEHGTLTLESVELMAMAAEASGVTAIARPATRSAEHIDELLQVEGIDVLFIGPSDLSQSMGHPGNPKAPAVAQAQAIEASLRKMLAAGRTPGMPAGAEHVRHVLNQGVRYIYTHLPRLLAGSAKAYLKNARGEG